MGASNIEFVIKGKAKKSEIEIAFKERQASDAIENGRQEGYSGDFQTVRRVDYSMLADAFPDFNSAWDACLDKAQKWDTVCAVYFKNAKGETDTLIAGWGAS